MKGREVRLLPAAAGGSRWIFLTKLPGALAARTELPRAPGAEGAPLGPAAALGKKPHWEAPEC